MAKQAKEFLAALNRNVDAWYAGRSDYETFNARQRATWDAIHGAGQAVEEMVLGALRDQLPPAKRAF
jgi:hypothetical protein